MEHKQFSEQQIVALLQQAERGDKTIRDRCREHNLTETTSLPSVKVIGVLSGLFVHRGAPRLLKSDNAPEFIAGAL
jgi:hypothetical protein